MCIIHLISFVVFVQVALRQYKVLHLNEKKGHSNNNKDAEFDTIKLEDEIRKLILDDDVTKKAGIYPYVLTRNEKYLSIRTFSDNEKLQAYTKQNGICKICGKHFELEEMEADHITPWSQGGKTNLENSQMLCGEYNRRKSDK